MSCCQFHPEEEAVTKCAVCGANLCSPCDTNAFFRVEKGALCLRCSLKEAKHNVAFTAKRLGNQIKKVIFAALLFASAITSWVIADNEGSAFASLLVFVFWFLCGFIQTRGHERDENSVKSIIWEGHEEDDITLGKVIFYVFAAPVMLIINFIKDFLCIHPFNDGNGRMSRLITTLLLYRSGFVVCKYISLEKKIEKTKDTYYDVLEQSSENWNEGKKDNTPFVKYLLGIILSA